MYELKRWTAGSDTAWMRQASEMSRAHGALEEFLDGGRLRTLFQPIVRLSAGTVFAYEALTRVESTETRPTEEWLDLASINGVRDEFELACIEAIAACGPPPDDALLFVNMSASLLAHPAARELRDRLPSRLVVELTEREAVEDYEVLRERIAVWQGTGVHLAIDDTGSGWSTLRHVVQLHPDFIKLDRSLISGLDRDRNCRALVSALAAFARESGATVIAEGVERAEEMEGLRDADVDLAQGWLFSRPGRPWASAVVPDHGRAPAIKPRETQRRARLEERLAAATRPEDACDLVAAHLFGLGGVMPSVYLERGGLLRCQAQRGLWQVLDGMPPAAGVTGHTFATGDSVVLDDVRASSDYLEAIPGVVSECCVPIVARDRTVGSLNVESFAPLSPAVVDEAHYCAAALGARLSLIGTQSVVSPHQRLARHGASLSELLDDPALHQRCIDATIEVSGMDSAAMALGEGDDLTVVGAGGPLAHVLERVGAGDLRRLSSLVDRVASCYTAGDSTGAGFVGTDSLRAAGARAVAVVPLVSGGRRLGILVAASMLPTAFDHADAETIEMLGAHVASCIDRSNLFAKLRHATERDVLTGLRNRATFDERLAAFLEVGATTGTVLLADIDRFKSINDTDGHLAGDAVLRAVASALRTTLSDGVVFRLGGDEFAALLPEADPAELECLGRRLVDAAAAVLGSHGASLSVGLAIVDVAEESRALLGRADRALYHAKRNGLGVWLAAPEDEGGRPPIGRNDRRGALPR